MNDGDHDSHLLPIKMARIKPHLELRCKRHLSLTMLMPNCA